MIFRKTWLVSSRWPMALATIGLWSMAPAALPLDAAYAQTCAVDPAVGFPASGTAGALSFSCGPGAFTNGDNSTSLGYSAGTFSLGEYNTFTGSFAGSFAIGSGNTGTGASAGSFVNGANNTAMGSGAGSYVAGSDNVAIGSGAGSGFFGGSINASRTVAVGAGSIASQDDAIAIGSQARADHANAIAIGTGATTTRADQVMIGTASNTYTLGGISTAASRTAQNGGNAALPTYFVSTDVDGNLASSSFSLQQVEQTMTTVAGHTAQLASHFSQLASHSSRIASLDGRVGALEARIGTVGGEVAAARTEARQGIAATIAMASAPMPSTVGKTSWAMNIGYFKSEAAVGGSITHRFDTAIPLGLTLGYAYGGGDSHAARLGIMGEF